MPTIYLETEINAPIERCFDLSRSIDFHQACMIHTQEEAVEGITSGLIGLGQQVTWRAKHFGTRQTLTSKITACDRPSYFCDEMISGAFNSICHEHWFEAQQGKTILKDHFHYTAPLGLLGKLADVLFLKRYMKNLLSQRNTHLKQALESETWQEYLPLN